MITTMTAPKIKVALYIRQMSEKPNKILTMRKAGIKSCIWKGQIL
jgi:hypothetical protein